MGVDREFMTLYIGSAGPGPGGRPEGRADGLAGGRGDFERRYNDFHRFSQKTYKNLLCLVNFASDFHKNHIKPLCFIAKMKTRLQKHAKTIVFFDFSNHPNAQVPICYVQKPIFEHLRGSRGSRQNGARTATSDLPTTRRGVKMTEVLTNSLKILVPR